MDLSESSGVWWIDRDLVGTSLSRGVGANTIAKGLHKVDGSTRN